MPRHYESYITAQVLRELLRQTLDGKTASLVTISSGARCSPAVAREVLDRLEIPYGKECFTLSRQVRLRLAIEACRIGAGDRTVTELDWREFESLAKIVLLEFGYYVQSDVWLQYEGRKWQIDVAAVCKSVLLCVDCKHWNTPSYPSKFVRAVEHQLTVTHGFLKQSSNDAIEVGLPLILTHREPPERKIGNVLLLSIGQLPSFLVGLFEHLNELPVIARASDLDEKPIKPRAF